MSFSHLNLELKSQASAAALYEEAFSSNTRQAKCFIPITYTLERRLSGNSLFRAAFSSVPVWRRNIVPRLKAVALERLNL